MPEPPSNTGEKNFDKLAPVYRWLEWLTFGPFLSRARTAFLADMKACTQALILGDGDGRFTARLLRANPRVEIDAVDSSPAMLEALRRRIGTQSARVHTTCADIRGFKPAYRPYDLVATHFFLDCLTTPEVHSLVRAVRSSMTSESLWVISEFEIPPGVFGRLVARPVVSLLYRAFGVLAGLPVRSLPDYASALRDAGFVRIRRRTFLSGLLISEIWQPH